MGLIRLAILTLTFFTLLTAKAQQYELGISALGTGYMGDLNPANPLYFDNVGAGITAKYNFNSTWGIKLGLSHLTVSASDRDFSIDYQQNRNLYFSNRISELSLTSEFSFFKMDRSRLARRYSPYLLAGIAAIHHDPYVIYGQEKIKLRELLLEYDPVDNNKMYSKFALATPIGVGLKYKLNEVWKLGAELSYRILWTDNVDNVSKNYPTMTPSTALLSNQTVKQKDGTSRSLNQSDWEYLADPTRDLANRAGTARGDGKKNDGLITAGLTLTYTFISTKCYFW